MFMIFSVLIILVKSSSDSYILMPKDIYFRLNFTTRISLIIILMSSIAKSTVTIGGILIFLLTAVVDVLTSISDSLSVRSAYLLNVFTDGFDTRDCESIRFFDDGGCGE